MQKKYSITNKVENINLLYLYENRVNYLQYSLY